MTQERNWEEADNVRVYVSLPEFSFVTVIKMMEKMYCLEGGDEDVIDESGELAALAELLQIQQVSSLSIHNHRVQSNIRPGQNINYPLLGKILLSSVLPSNPLVSVSDP